MDTAPPLTPSGARLPASQGCAGGLCPAACGCCRSHRAGCPTSKDFRRCASCLLPLTDVSASRQGAERRFATSAGWALPPVHDRQPWGWLGLGDERFAFCRSIVSAPPSLRPMPLGRHVASGANALNARAPMHSPPPLTSFVARGVQCTGPWFLLAESKLSCLPRLSADWVKLPMELQIDTCLICVNM